ncbi:MAG: hypothetical protein RL685_4199 [Pseudomonadota bacterium]|jgi:hypothetical protein
MLACPEGPTRGLRSQRLARMRTLSLSPVPLDTLATPEIPYPWPRIRCRLAAAVPPPAAVSILE